MAEVADAILSREDKVLPDTDSADELIAHLEAVGLKDVSQELRDHLEVLEKDPDEPPVSIESLRSLVEFVGASPWLAVPLVISDHEGLVGLEWHIQGDEGPADWDYGKGVVSLIFLRSGIVRYVALSAPNQEGRERLRAQGETTKGYVLPALGAFAP